jgi:hypothetical protein
MKIGQVPVLFRIAGALMVICCRVQLWNMWALVDDRLMSTGGSCGDVLLVLFGAGGAVMCIQLQALGKGCGIKTQVRSSDFSGSCWVVVLRCSCRMLGGAWVGCGDGAAFAVVAGCTAALLL